MNLSYILPTQLLLIFLTSSFVYSNPSMVYDLYPNGNSSEPTGLTVFNSQLFFAATDGTTGIELWRYNDLGAPLLVADINPTGDSYPRSFAIFNSKLYFSAYDRINGRELWVFDGTNAPTMVADINTIVADIYTGGSSIPSGLTVYNSKLYFSADDGINGTELWVYDGVNPPSMVANINPNQDINDPNYGNSDPRNLKVYNSKLYFSANDGSNGSELWVYDGVNPPSMVANINPESYVYDGGSYMSQGSSEPSSLTIFKSKLYFSANDGTNGAELWVYDGNTTPTMAADINPDAYYYEPSYGDFNGCSFPSNMTEFNSKLYFSADDGTNGAELWVYDGVSPPKMLANINTDPYVIYKGGANGFSYPSDFIVFNSKLYFSASEGYNGNGREIWVYDGVNPPSLFADIYPGNDNASSNPSYLTEYNYNLYFSADNGVSGRELWVYKTPRPPAPEPKSITPILYILLKQPES
ncbi:MAG: hypothetical protein SCH71_11640 [Desulfobulbaceae bacterium]|nr:hypothetical protein [Desulfobulbaceae bacterium]